MGTLDVCTRNQSSDFTEAEIREYLDKASVWRQAHRMPALSGAEVNDAIARLGGRPADAHDLVESSLSVAQFVETRIGVEIEGIETMLQVDPRYAGVYRALLREGQVSFKVLRETLGQPISDIAGKAVGKRNVLSYNPVEQVVQFHSQVTAEAARQWAAEEAAKEAKKLFFQKI